MSAARPARNVFTVLIEMPSAARPCRRVARARVLQRRPELLRREGEVHVHTSPARPERRHHGGGDDGSERQPGQLQADEQVVHGVRLGARGSGFGLPAVAPCAKAGGSNPLGYSTRQTRITTSVGRRSPVPTKIDRVSHCSSGAEVSKVGTVLK